MGGLKAAALRAATAGPVVRALRRTMRHHATIFMLHRFRNPDTGSDGIDPEVVRRGLARLRVERFPLIGLEELFRRLAADEPLEGAVAFTIDDGYLDHATVAAPLFAEFDCPVTTFLCTGFLDRQLWFWWDRIEYVFRNTSRTSMSVTLGDRQLECTWTAEAERQRTRRDFIERCKRVPAAEKHAAIDRLGRAAEVEIPDLPPPEYGPMSWDQARTCEKRGMTFGPHTVTHPILSQTPAAQSEAELSGSWNRLREELNQPVPVFCYPNGGSLDFGARELATLGALELAGAVVGEPGYVGTTAFHARPDARWRVRRFAFPERLPMMLQYASGLERFKERLRGRED